MILNNLTLFLRIVEKGGMAAAGRELGLSPATVSERLATLETYYGARLLTRTTRSIRLTEEGQLLVDGARRLLAEAEEIKSRIKLGVEKISGTIRMSIPVDLGRNRIARRLVGFIEHHPDIKIDLVLSDGYSDLVAQGFDLALRYGNLADSTLRSKTLGRNQRIVCASPDYLETNGVPKHPDDLPYHNCILMRFENSVDNEWKFLVDGREKLLLVQGNRIVNDGELARNWCRDSHGIALKSIWDVHNDLQSGALVQVLKKFAPPPTNIQLVYPSGAVQPRRIRLLIEQLSDWFVENAVQL